MKYAIGLTLICVGTAARFQRAVGGYLRMNRSWHCAWAMAERKSL